MQPDVAVVILTYNEEANIRQALESVCGWASQVFVFDSNSTDRTLAIAKEFPCEVMQHPFENYGKQRNAALDRLPIKTQWVFFLDADEWAPLELKAEISQILLGAPEHDAYFVKYRLIWMGRWVRHGYYPTWILRLFRHGKGRCEARGINEHLVVPGTKGYLKHDLMHEDKRGLGRWVEKHNQYAAREAAELFALRTSPNGTRLEGRLFGTQAERKRWIWSNVWTRLPPLVRPFAYFGYRYVGKGGFLDGKEALVFHVMQGLWYIMLIDAKYLELCQKEAEKKEARVPTIAREETA